MAVTEFFLLLEIFAAVISVAFAGNVMTPSTSLTYDQKLTSPRSIFELVFFSPDSAKSYLGIRYSKDQTVVVWVANRNLSLPISVGALNLTKDGNLVLYDNASSSIVWSTDTSTTNPQLQLLDSGNLVLTDLTRNTTLWQSFDHPCDTSLPGIKLGVLNLQDGSVSPRRLVSWKSATDPSPGDYSYEMEARKVAEFYIKKGPTKLFRTGPWNGRTFSGYPDLQARSQLKYYFPSDNSGVYYLTETDDPSLLSRAVMNPQNGKYERFQLNLDDQQSTNWNLMWSLPKDDCDKYQTCGPNRICKPSYSTHSCECIEGFVPVSGEEGCKRRRPLNCPKDKFRRVENVKLPETVNATADNSRNTLEKCRDWCLQNCSCMAYATVGPSGCVTWPGDLSDLRAFPDSGGADEIYVRLSASEFEDKQKLVLIVTLPLVLGFLLLCCLGLLTWRRRRTKQDFLESDTESSAKDTIALFSLAKLMEKDPANIMATLPSYDLSTIKAATNGFSDDNKLGEGGFGVVYKGELQDGQQIAVKKLSGKSSQGPDEFRNELTVIANLQHRNLVRLLGSCIEGNERILILEFMENKSLDAFIYDKARSGSLDWQKRLDIIIGIARGLLYLHQDSNLRVIHRDLKPSNILLDKDMNPKISDFGIARIFEGDEFEENATTRPIGTFGYMAPEYLSTGIFSFKSDVFSFGVIILEILSGRRNRIFNQADTCLNLLGHAYKLWKEGRPLEILDEGLDCSCPPGEIVDCIRMGLLCVQERSEDRPTMAEVVMMLASEDQLQTPLKEPTMKVLSFDGDFSSSSKEISAKVTGR